MKKYRQLLRACVPCLLLAVVPLLSHCGEAAGYGTETGNPPQLEERQLYLEVAAGGIRVVGTPGAVAPLGASVRVTNVTTGASVETTAASDGSLDVVIAGEPGDELEVTVSSGGQETSQRLSFSAIGRRTDLSSVSCGGLEAMLAQTVGEVFSITDVACAVDVDCVYAAPEAAAPCYYDCGVRVVSRAGAAFVSSQGQEQTAPLCTALEACVRPEPEACPTSSPGLPTCVSGFCEAVVRAPPTCNELLESAEARRTQLRESADRQCARDADCAVARVGVRCLGDCGRPFEGVAQSAVAALEASVQDEVDSSYCAVALSYGCSDPDCGIPPQPVEAYCDGGTCAVRYPE
jgi:hypothetical protein